MKALVTRNTGSWYTVRSEDGKYIDCKIKGTFRLKGIRSTNPVAIGDWVDVDVPTSATTQEQTPFIYNIYDRKNYIIRKSINLSKQSQIIAANVDQAFLVITIAHPQTSTTFIDRFLASAQAYRIPVILLFNKIDLLNAEQKEYQDSLISVYGKIGYECIEISATNPDSVEVLGSRFKDKMSVLSGHSGVGKSTILNHFITGYQQKTAEISDAHDQGVHTTTFAEMFEARGGYLIDTPGIRGFGTFDFEREEIGHYFIDIFQYSKQCRFSNCTHTHEPGCAVLQAIEDGHIAQTRYNSYLSMLGDKDENRYREKL